MNIPAPKAPAVNSSPGKRYAEKEVLIAGERMKEIEKTDVFRMPERAFVSVFLHYFHSGQIDKRYIPDHCETGLDTWISIVGNGYAEVEVYDQRGVVLFTVPPLMNRLAVRTQFNSSQGIARDITNANLYGAYSENHTTRHLEESLAKRKMLNVDVNVLHAYADRWNSIYTRYGLEKLATKTLDEVIKPTEVKKDKIETDYDEWEQA